MNVKSIIKFIDYAKYAAAGAIGGLALVNTYQQIVGASVMQGGESIAMAAGATLLVGLAKIVHAV
jgi:hypothetical protein